MHLKKEKIVSTGERKIVNKVRKERINVNSRRANIFYRESIRECSPSTSGSQGQRRLIDTQGRSLVGDGEERRARGSRRSSLLRAIKHAARGLVSVELDAVSGGHVREHECHDKPGRGSSHHNGPALLAEITVAAVRHAARHDRYVRLPRRARIATRLVMRTHADYERACRALLRPLSREARGRNSNKIERAPPDSGSASA